MSNFRWSNIPIPEGHGIVLVIGVALHIWRPLILFEMPWLKHAVGWPALLLGVLLAAWAVMTIRDMDIGRPTKIVVSGPYSFSRNPMYVAWTTIYIGTAMLVNTWWLIILLPALMAFTHYFVVRREEQDLEQQFGAAYRKYCERVPRYL